MSIKTSSIFDEYKHRNTQIPTGVRICFWMVGIGILFFVLGLLIDNSFIGGSGVACFWLGILCFRFTGFGDSTDDIEHLGEKEPSEACPKCGAEGIIEAYIKVSNEIYPGILGHTKVTRKVAMVNCMNISCSYRCSLKLHEKEAESVAVSMDLRNGLISDTNDNKASVVINATEEEEHRQELRQMRRDRNGIYLDINGKWGVHPDSPRLQAEFGACPECSGGVRFCRWVHKKDGHIVLGILSLVECERKETCGYISKLQRHKKRIQEASQVNGEHDDGNQMQSLLASSVEMV